LVILPSPPSSSSCSLRLTSFSHLSPYRYYLWTGVFRHAGANLGSLLWALTNVLLVVVVGWLLARKDILIKL